MQIAQCVVRLGGDVGMEVLKTGVTVPEVAILRDAHGEGSIVRVRLSGQDRRAHAEERDRLARAYGAERVLRLFPGVAPRLPVKFDEIGIDVMSGHDEPASAPAPADLPDDDGDDGADGDKE